MSREGFLFPTPNTMDHLGPRSAEAQEYQLRRGVEGGSYRNTTGNLREDIQRLMLLPTPAAQLPGFRNRTPVTGSGEHPTHGNQRWYDAESGRLMQKGLEQVLLMSD